MPDNEPPGHLVLADIDRLRTETLRAIEAAGTNDALEHLRVSALGRKGSITGLLKGLGGLEPEERRLAGAALNQLKAEITAAIEGRREQLLDAESVLTHVLDVTLPGAGPSGGALHPTTQMMYDLNDAFTSLNFEIFEGPEITSELYEFDSLNFPGDHPARESMDTYWLAGYETGRGADRLCIRPHLTGASVRYMQQQAPPFRFVYPGRVYRNETTDASHERAFFQYEALIVDRDVPFTAGRLLVNTILDTVFGRAVTTRMRAGYFPFVEPGFEIDMQCLVCGGKGCRVCKQVGWLEIMPGGMPHPNVFRAGGLDPDQWMGFYINIGLDRLVMMRYGIDDVRLFHSGDLRFLSQFK
jgi:phenylalanyl-tRNA synthetase alpha chain